MPTVLEISVIPRNGTSLLMFNFSSPNSVVVIRLRCRLIFVNVYMIACKQDM